MKVFKGVLSVVLAVQMMGLAPAVSATNQAVEASGAESTMSKEEQRKQLVTVLQSFSDQLQGRGNQRITTVDLTRAVSAVLIAFSVYSPTNRAGVIASFAGWAGLIGSEAVNVWNQIAMLLGSEKVTEIVADIDRVIANELSQTGDAEQMQKDNLNSLINILETLKNQISRLKGVDANSYLPVAPLLRTLVVVGGVLVLLDNLGGSNDPIRRARNQWIIPTLIATYGVATAGEYLENNQAQRDQVVKKINELLVSLKKQQELLD